MTTPEKDKTGLIRRLLSGKIYIKEGHRVKKLNPNGESVEVDLGFNQIEERVARLSFLIRNHEIPSTDPRVVEIRQKYPEFNLLHSFQNDVK